MGVPRDFTAENRMGVVLESIDVSTTVFKDGE